LPEMTRDPAFVEMLLTEARVAATLSHPNVVQTFDVGEVEGTYFIAMEHIHGEDIRGIVRQMKRVGKLDFPLSLALHIAIGLCAGLAYAHGKRGLDGVPMNIVHRDISPQNIVVTFSGDVKIVDFGVAKSDSKFQNFTESGKLKGKIPYMSPEQARGANVDWRSDVFSAGILLYELTTGKRLFKGESEYETMRMICERPYARPAEIVPGYAPELDRIVMKALTRDRDLRYQSAREMQADLEAFARKERIEASSVGMATFMAEVFGAERAREADIGLADRQALARLRLESISDISASGRKDAPTSFSNGAGDGAPQSLNTLTGVSPMELPASGAKRFFALGVSAALVALLSATGVFVYLSKTRAVTVAPKTGALRIESSPDNAAIWINGNLQGPKTPATLEDLPLDQSLNVRVTLDGFEPATAEAKAMPAGVGTGPETLTLKLGPGLVSVELRIKPDGAKVTLDGKAMTGALLSGVSSGMEHELVVSAAGFDDKRIKFEGRAYETKRFDIALDKTKAVPSGPLTLMLPLPSGLASNSAKPMVSAGGTAALAVSIAPTVSAKPTATAPPKPKGSGFLNVAAAGGWCNVSVDGAGKGPTPLARIELSEGTHTVTCTSEGKTQSAVVVISDGGTARHKFTIAQ
jgi:eukaryotic-like serine/threonine-protein kinase